MNRVYREAGVTLPETSYVGDFDRFRLGRSDGRGASVREASPWMPDWRRLYSHRLGLDGNSRHAPKGAVDRGFVLSDHADWSGLLATIAATEAERIFVTHGYSSILVRWLNEQGKDAQVLPTRYEGERDEASAEENEPTPDPPMASS